ncbi:transmembrane protein, putative [Rhizoctonia solani AG-3 Rhs1AP]|uniref:Transmembrane protein, putative n=2 Tax=Rhizoctonia solani AG-3 TaxID=1086053 RepID=X8J5F7_9AGAM|nr:transmembrane protein, putative [Rhizoctonia solani AG-3 Rhs1AP]KEP47374.1 putative transmembrane protein [Rhizoctonia solani 123E]
MATDSKLENKLPPHFTKDPDATEPELVAKRREQWRHFSRDPYKPPRDDEKQSQSTEQAPESQKQEPTEYTRRLRHPGSGWTLLFYDLAWTATFATLSQSGSFIEPMDAISYFGFFAAVLWLWASQTLYCVHFYTNDWFHLTSIFLQLIIFGLLAATTKGYHLTNYISRSPGSTELNSSADQISDEDALQRFNAERTDLFSAKAMALAFALTRFLHLLQYLRACWYARWGKGAENRGHTPRGRFLFDRVHPQVYAIIVGLIFSNMMLFAAMGIMFSSYGTSVAGASIKLGLWIGGFLLEILSHLWHPVLRLMAPRRNQKEGQEENSPGAVHWTEDVNPLPLAKVDLCERLDTITTIILGEALNGNEGISKEIKPMIANYTSTTNFTSSLEDARMDLNFNVDLGEMEYYKILTQLLHGSFEGARYILVFAALIPICLGIQCIVHSLPRDRYQWAVITSRLALGLLLAFLLLLNIGKYQEFYVSRLVANQRAGVFLWLDAFWVLPTIAIAYAIQFLLEIVLAYFAKQATEKAKQADTQLKAEAGVVRTSAMVIGGAAVLNQLPQIHYADPSSSEQDDKRGSEVD